MVRLTTAFSVYNEKSLRTTTFDIMLEKENEKCRFLIISGRVTSGITKRIPSAHVCVFLRACAACAFVQQSSKDSKLFLSHAEKVFLFERNSFGHWQWRRLAADPSSQLATAESRSPAALSVITTRTEAAGCERPGGRGTDDAGQASESVRPGSGDRPGAGR